jgi:hypothetical protein
MLRCGKSTGFFVASIFGRVSSLNGIRLLTVSICFIRYFLAAEQLSSVVSLCCRGRSTKTPFFTNTRASGHASRGFFPVFVFLYYPITNFTLLNCSKTNKPLKNRDLSRAVNEKAKLLTPAQLLRPLWLLLHRRKIRCRDSNFDAASRHPDGRSSGLLGAWLWGCP